MKPAMSVVYLLFLLLLLLAETSQGIRLEEESLAAFRKIIHKESFMGGGDAVGEVSCRDGGLCSGRSRKLMTETMATSKSERSNERDIGHHSMEEVDKRKRPEDFHMEPPETYPDILDIAGMDYSPAKRKPPIHN